MEDYPRTVADPRQWLSWGLRTLTPAGGAYGIAVTVVAGLTVRSLELGNLGVVAIAMGFAVGAVLGLVCGTVDGMLVRTVAKGRLRLATTLVNGIIAAVVMLLLGFDAITAGVLYVFVLVIGPGVVAGAVTYRSSPEARRIHG